MPAPSTSVPSADPARSAIADPAVLARRGLLRGGAALAGAAAGAIAVGAATASPAHAADGDPVLVGADNEGEATTTLTIATGPSPTLTLNNSSGPTLKLEPLLPNWQGELAIGEIVNTDLGPVIGVDIGDGPTTSYLATAFDLDDLPTPFAVPPVRLIDTRRSQDRAAALQTSPGAFDATGRLKAGAWIDVPLSIDNGNFWIEAAHLNVTATGAATAGYVSVYGPGPYPGTSTLNFLANQTLANAAFTPVGVVLGSFAIRVRTTAPVYVIVDFSGGAVQGRNALPGVAAKAARKTRARSKLVARVISALGR